jgi:8-hydroxy-5-deazaflavin:NADPH oxidoreductase
MSARVIAATLTAKTVGPNQTTVLVAGDDATAKDALISAITAGGIGAIDAESLSRARELEAVGSSFQGRTDGREEMGGYPGFTEIELARALPLRAE